MNKIWNKKLKKKYFYWDWDFFESALPPEKSYSVPQRR